MPGPMKWHVPVWAAFAITPILCALLSAGLGAALAISGMQFPQKMPPHYTRHTAFG